MILCKSRRSAERTKVSITRYIEGKLFLKVNGEKTSVANISQVKYLGYGFYRYKGECRLKVHKKSIAKMKERLRAITNRGKAISNEERPRILGRYVKGWVNYFKLADMKKMLQVTDEWLRRKIRAVYWKQWKKIRTRYKMIRRYNLPDWNVHVEAGPLDDFDYQLLGYLTPRKTGFAVPVFEGLEKPTRESLMNLGAQLNTGGNVALYHIVGFTPEAKTRQDAFQGQEPEKEVTITRPELEAMSGGDAGAAFVAGKVDAAVTFQPWLSKAEGTDFGHTIINSKSSPGVIVDTFAMKKDYVKAHPEVAKAIVRGWYDALAFMGVGIAQAALDMAVAYAKERVVFGDTLSNYQGIRWMLAEMETDVQAARWLTYYAASLKDTGRRFSKEAACAKLFSSEAAHRVVNKALQIHGGYGYMKEYPIERLYRDQRILEIFEGTSQIQKIVISGNLLK